MGEFISATKEALRPRILDGSAKTIEVTGNISTTQGIVLTIVIEAPSGGIETQYLSVWELTGAKGAARSEVAPFTPHPPVSSKTLPTAGKPSARSVLAGRKDTDLRLDPDTYDLIVSDKADFEIEDGFDSALLTALLTDRRADASQVPDSTRRRGWVGDLNNPLPIGSYWWLLDSSRLNTRVKGEFISATKEALQPRLLDGSAESIEVTGKISPALGIVLTIVIKSPAGEVETRYVPIWELTGNAS
jgi:phage gp46-like protein